jgi:Uma2 family endonuclease
MIALRKELVTAEEYLAWEELQPTRHEFYKGLIYPHGGDATGMAGGSRKHARIITNLAAILTASLHDSPCQVFVSDMRLKVENAKAYFYPDTVVTCDPDDLKAEDCLTSPSVIIEVLSSSTSAYDRSEKFAAYRMLASLREYVLIDPESKVIERYTHNADESWQLVDFTGKETLELASIGATLPASVIFENVDAPAA